MLADLGNHDNEEEAEYARTSMAIQEIVNIEENPNSKSLQVKGMYTQQPNSKTKKVTISLDSSIKDIEEENKEKTAQYSDKQLR